MNSIVTMLSASDPDNGVNSQITFSFVGDNGGFRIDPITGVVTVLDPSRLDAEGRSPIVFVQVVASDGGNPSLSSQTLVSEGITDNLLFSYKHSPLLAKIIKVVV